MSGEYYGSKVAVPCSRKVMEEILPYLGYYPEYTDEEAENSEEVIADDTTETQIADESETEGDVE